MTRARVDDPSPCAEPPDVGAAMAAGAGTDVGVVAAVLQPGEPRGASARRLGGLVLAGGGTRVIALLSQVAIARLIGPAQVGSLAVALALCMGMAVLSDAGLTALSVRRIVRTPDERSDIVTATLIVQVLLTTGLGAILVALGLLLPWQGNIGVLLAISAPALLCVAFNTLYVFIAAEQIAAISVLRLVLAAAPAAASIAAAVMFRSAAAVLIANIIGFVVYDAAVLLWARHTLGLRFARRPTRAAITEMCRAGLPVMASALLLLVPTVAATVVAGAVLGPRGTGIFSAAWQFSFAAVGLWMLIVDVVYPMLVRHWAACDGAFTPTVRTLALIGLRAALPLCVFVSFAAGPLVGAVYGRRFTATVDVLRILIWILPLALLWTLLSQALLAADGERLLLRMTMVSNAVLVSACVLGAVLFDERGVAIGCLVGGTVQVGLYARTPALRAQGLARTTCAQALYAVLPAALCAVVLVLGLAGTNLFVLLGCSLAGFLVAETMSGTPSGRALHSLANL